MHNYNSLAIFPTPAAPNTKFTVMGVPSVRPVRVLRTTQTIAVLLGGSSLTVTSCESPVNAITVQNEQQNQEMSDGLDLCTFDGRTHATFW